MVIGFLCLCVIHSQGNFKAPAAAIDSWGHFYSLSALCPLSIPSVFLSSLSLPFFIFPFRKYVGIQGLCQGPFPNSMLLLKLHSTIYAMHLNRILLHLPGMFTKLNALKMSWLFSNCFVCKTNERMIIKG